MIAAGATCARSWEQNVRNFWSVCRPGKIGGARPLGYDGGGKALCCRLLDWGKCFVARSGKGALAGAESGECSCAGAGVIPGAKLSVLPDTESWALPGLE